MLLSALMKMASWLVAQLGIIRPRNTAFCMMFAFRAEYAPPGVADLLLEAVIAEAEGRGHGLVNLGLGIDGGIEFFKRSGATPCLALR